MGEARFQWLRTGRDAFIAMLAAIDGAKLSVRMETYIFASGPLGERFRTALVAAAQRNVRVRVLIDAFGSLYLPDAFWTPLRQAGGEVRQFNPLGFRMATSRDHRKLLICDDEVAFVGGLNVTSEHDGDGVESGWRDLALRLQGPMVVELAKSFEAMFVRASMPHGPFAMLRRSSFRSDFMGEGGKILLSGPGRGRAHLTWTIIGDLTRARTVRIIAAYFLPPVRIRRALARAARRGGSVELILPGRSDVPVARLAGQNLYGRLLRAGVAIYEYEPQIMHTKLMIIDDACYVGSANLDPRSLSINYELLLRLTDAQALAEAKEIFDDHRAHSRRVDRRAWMAGRTLWQRFKAKWAYFFLARVDPFLTRYQARRWLKTGVESSRRERQR